MRITNLNKGENYQLKPNTQIQIERTNPFFNDYGEQTTPLGLPASDHNRRLLGFPDTFGNQSKMVPMDVAIQDGEYFSQCRQIVLSAQHKGIIETTFYINDGSFYSRIRDIRLKDIFKDEFVPGVETVDQAIAFCRTLRNDADPVFSIFPVLLTNDSGLSEGLDYKVLNAYGREASAYSIPVWTWDGSTMVLVEQPQTVFFHPDLDEDGCDFYNATDRTEYVDQVPISISPGYYMSPFVRANYLLQRVFAYFGYELQPNFFTQTSPFDKMVVINNVTDALVNGRIRVADLVPDVTCADFISVFRKRFCCEFTVDEGKRTADVIFLRDALSAPPVADLTHCMTSEPNIAYKSEKDYKRITLASENNVDSDATESYDDMSTMVSACPTAYLNPVDGAFYKTGFSGDYRVETKIGGASQSYNTGEALEKQEIKVPDLMPEFRKPRFAFLVNDVTAYINFDSYLYIGDGITRNSKMMVATENNSETTDKAHIQPVMLSFTYLSGSAAEGTITSYAPHGVVRSVLNRHAQPRIFDYSLCYNGPDGIFERFYRDYDLILRNALHDMKATLMLSKSQKQNLPAHGKVIIRGVPFFFNKLKFTLGGKDDPVESELLSISLMQPLSSPATLTDLLPAMTTTYVWVGRSSQTEVTVDDYNNAGVDKNRTFKTIYPPIPSAQYAGIQYMKQSSFTSEQIQHASFWRHSKWRYTRTDVWLECLPK